MSDPFVYLRHKLSLSQQIISQVVNYCDYCLSRNRQIGCLQETILFCLIIVYIMNHKAVFGDVHMTLCTNIFICSLESAVRKALYQLSFFPTIKYFSLSWLACFGACACLCVSVYR